MNDKIKSISINLQTSILDALRKMDILKIKLLLVADDDLFVSLLSIGDIQRAIIANVSLDSPIAGILRPKVKVVTVHDELDKVKAYMREKRNEFMPVLDDANRIVDVVFWKDLFSNESNILHRNINLPIVIMAGGKGARLKPLTNVLPKPLIPIGEQTMLEDIMDRFVDCGCRRFYISVNYKADTIKRYFEGLKCQEYDIEYFQEDKPLGTAGSLHLLDGKINSTFFVSNCDIIVDDDYAEILDYHRRNRNEITVVAALKNYSIPYGTLETGEDGVLKCIQEKPNLTFKINTGMYVLEPHLINEIPQDRFYHITFLIEKLLNEKRQVGVFPINEGSWIDVGNWDEYFKYIKK